MSGNSHLVLLLLLVVVVLLPLLLLPLLLLLLRRHATHLTAHLTAAHAHAAHQSNVSSFRWFAVIVRSGHVFKLWIHARHSLRRHSWIAQAPHSWIAGVVFKLKPLKLRKLPIIFCQHVKKFPHLANCACGRLDLILNLALLQALHLTLSSDWICFSTSLFCWSPNFECTKWYCCASE
jgi:hypothetical protein